MTPGLLLTALLAAAASATAPNDPKAAFAEAGEAAPEQAIAIDGRVVGFIPHENGSFMRYRVLTLARTSGTWKKVAENAPGDEWSVYGINDGPRPLTFAGKQYVYVELHLERIGTAFIGSGGVEFHLVDPLTGDVHTLRYEGAQRGKKIKGEFERVGDLVKRPDLAAAFEAQASKSPRLFQPGDIDPMAWLDRWQEKNARLLETFQKERRRGSKGPLPVTWERYDTDPMAAFGAEPFGAEENAQYEVVSYFRGSLIGFDKKAKKYFPVWADTCAHGCHKTLVSLDQNALVFSFEEWTPPVLVTVDLAGKTVQFAPIEE